jgi:hypothetical protein
MAKFKEQSSETKYQYIIKKAANAAFFIPTLNFAICYLLFAICSLLFALCYLLFAI